MSVSLDWWEEACRELAARDPVLGEVMARYPASRLQGRGAALETLLRAVVGQQISVKAAAAVWARFGALVGEELRAGVVLGLRDEQLRAAGLSMQKVKYIRGICAGFEDGTVHPGLWEGMADAAIVAELVKLPGIGRWTAEMFLIFHLLRPDVLPLDDLGLLKGFERLYGPVRGIAGLEGMKRWKVVAAALDKRAESWRPYRTVGTWFLWRSLDPVEVNY